MDIAIIEDTELEALYLSKLLEKEGLEVSFYLNSSEGLQAVIDNKPQLVFLDLYMPEMDGFHICKEIKNNPETSDIPIIIITASADSNHLVKAFEIGVDDYLIKPLNDFEVSARIKVHIRNHKLLKELKETNEKYENQVEEYRLITEQLLETTKSFLDTDLKLKAVTNYNSDAVLFMQNNLITDCNKNAVEMFCPNTKGYILGRNILGFSPEFQSGGKLSDNKSETIFKALNQNGQIDFDWNFVNEKGVEFNAFVRLIKVSDESSAALIQKKLPQSLTTQLPGRTNVLNHEIITANIGVVVINVDGNIEFVNNTFAEMLGYTIKEITSRCFTDFFHPDDYTSEQFTFKEFISLKQNEFRVEKRFLKKDKKNVWVDLFVSTIYNSKGKIEKLVGIAIDISKVKRVEKNLIDGKNELDAILNNTSSIILLLNKDAEIVRINKTGLALANLSFNDVKSQRAGNTFVCFNNIKNLGDGYTRECSTCLLRTTVSDTIITQKGHSKVETKMELLKGNNLEEYIVSLSTNIITVDNEDYFLVVMDDITDRRKAAINL